MSNANRDYAIVYDVKNSSLVLSRPLNFYITDKNTSNIFIRLVTKISIGDGIDQYADIENASNYVLTMRVIKPNNEVKSIEATQHEPESIFQFDLTEGFKDIPGKYICELTISTMVSSRQELTTSDPFIYEVKRSILSNIGEIIEAEDTTVEKLLNDLEATKAELSSQIKDIATNKADKNSVFTMANMGQDIKEAMTGGSVAVVGKNTILTENIVDGQVTRNKFNNNIFEKNYIKISNITMSDNYIRFVMLLDINNIGNNNIALSLGSNDVDINLAQISFYESDNATLNTSDSTQVDYVNPNSNNATFLKDLNLTKRYLKIFVSFATYFDQKTIINFDTFGLRINGSYKDIEQIGQ